MMNNFMYKEIAGQWVGKVEGTNRGSLIINIDNNKTDEVGIMFNDQAPVYSIASRAFITRLPGDKFYKGKIGFFRHFDSKTRQMISASNPKDFASSGDVVFELKSNNTITGEWKTNIGTNGRFEANLQSQAPASAVKKILRWDQFKSAISKYVGTRGSFYFRGHQTSEYPLRNSFNRHMCWNLERYFQYLHELYEDLGRFNNDRYNIYDTIDFGAGLQLAQHHGFPTPLIDWTLSPYLAAYFAFRKFDRRENSAKSVRVLAFHQLRWGVEHEDSMNSNFISPWVVIKPLNLSLGNNQRAVAQDAVSVFSNIENLENELKDYLEYYDIDMQDQDLALSELESMGIYEKHLFPDVHTVCKVHKIQYFGEEPYTSALPRTKI